MAGGVAQRVLVLPVPLAFVEDFGTGRGAVSGSRRRRCRAQACCGPGVVVWLRDGAVAVQRLHAPGCVRHGVGPGVAQKEPFEVQRCRRAWLAQNVGRCRGEVVAPVALGSQVKIVALVLVEFIEESDCSLVQVSSCLGIPYVMKRPSGQ